MRKHFKLAGLVVSILVVLTSSAFAASYTFSDTTQAWPGYSQGGPEYYGNPKISSMVVTINDNTNMLQSVVIYLTGRTVFDSLFINTGGDGASYEAWDFYVKDIALTNGGANLYSVAANYEYLTAADVSLNYLYPRGDSPVGFKSGISYLNTEGDGGILASVLGTSTSLTYTFNDGIYMGSEWIIGYAPKCANDVILTPEPSIIMLLGFGLIGIAGLRRKMKKQ